MLCPHSNYMDDQAFFAAFNRRTSEDMIPINGGMDLTSGCNLQCRHCYIQSSSESMLRKQDVFRILNEAAAAGCLFMLLTGGEPMRHPAFPEIYRHAKRLGLLVTVFTNGTLIDEDTVRLFCDCTPLGVEVSVYGAAAGTHDAVTGIEGSFKRTMAGVRMLKCAGLNVSLKTMVMTLNEAEFDAMRLLAEELGVQFRMDAALFPRLTGEHDPVDLRVPPLRAVECEFLIPGRKAAWEAYVEKFGELQSDGSLYVCGAGRTSFHVTSEGRLQPCIMTSHIQADIKSQSFEKGWREISSAICRMKASSDNPCLKCRDSVLCDACPGFFKLETGNENQRSDYLCRIAEARGAVVQASQRVQEG